MATLPKEMLVRLIEVTELSDASMIEQAIEDIRVQNSAFADTLSTQADNFSYDQILAIVQESKEMITLHR